MILKGVKKIWRIHAGRKCPKGWKEISAQHLGLNCWILVCEKENPIPKNVRIPR